MGFFSYVFGPITTGFSRRHTLSREDAELLISKFKVNTLTDDEVEIIKDAIVDSRVDGKISLKKIDELLVVLVRNNRISENDRRGVYRVLKEHFKKAK